MAFQFSIASGQMPTSLTLKELPCVINTALIQNNSAYNVYISFDGSNLITLYPKRSLSIKSEDTSPENEKKICRDRIWYYSDNANGAMQVILTAR